MLLQEKIYTWKPAENLQGQFFMQSVIIDLDGFRIVLVRKNNHRQGIIVDFFAGVRSYRVTDELCAIHLLVGKAIGHKGLPLTNEEKNVPWAFLILEDSEYLKWISFQSNAISDFLGVVHYAIWTEDWIIDIASGGAAEIRFVDL